MADFLPLYLLKLVKSLHPHILRSEKGTGFGRSPPPSPYRPLWGVNEVNYKFVLGGIFGRTVMDIVSVKLNQSITMYS